MKAQADRSVSLPLNKSVYSPLQFSHLPFHQGQRKLLNPRGSFYLSAQLSHDVKTTRLAWSPPAPRCSFLSCPDVMGLVRKIRERSKKNEVMDSILCRSSIGSLLRFRAEPHGHIGVTKGAVQEDNKSGFQVDTTNCFEDHSHFARP